ncbi:hypothetical protein ACFYXM_11350 [Streptomyces sp. NPDC002476]|uniref:hypothetical protein n=1 Tax=Streptomyces sp. NPDC002476 TaxID=3364648 RepID=UPI0036C07005
MTETTTPPPPPRTTTWPRSLRRRSSRAWPRRSSASPALHRDGGCTHQDITVLDYPKGPADKPFLDTVYVVKAD